MTERSSSADMTVFYIEAVIRTMQDTSPESVVGSQVPMPTEAAETVVEGLRDAFERDPFAVLSEQSRKMFDVFHDPNLNDEQRAERLDGFFDLIESLDRAAFPTVEDVQRGVPTGYLPHGFTDLGGVSSLIPEMRGGRAMNYVDTAAILRRHRPVFEFLFKTIHPDDFSGPERHLRFAQNIITNIATQISMNLTVGNPEPTERGGVLPLSTVDTVICQQSGLIAQVLMQAFGLRTRLSKNYVAGQRELTDYGLDFPGGFHVSNVVTLMGPEGERTYMVDTQNPQSKDGKWKPGIFRMDNQLPGGGWLVTGLDGTQRKYTERPDDMYWKIER